MISRHTVDNKHYADEAIEWAIKEGKTYFDMEQFAAKSIPDPGLYAYFIGRIKAVLN